MVKVAVNGSLGKMGKRILCLAAASKEFKVTAAFEHVGCPVLGQDAGSHIGYGKNIGVPLSRLNAEALKSSDVIIDFSSPEGSLASLEAAVKANKRIVIGTTSVGAKVEAKIKEASKKIPVLFSPNMSLGANFLFELARLAALKLQPGYDIEIIEAHHRLKKDAPSGTAKKIAEVIADAKKWDLSKVAKYGREGIGGERPINELGIHVIRGGETVGDHTVLFSGPGETIELKHVAQSRDAFARGSLTAALFLSKKKKGLYNMRDVLL